jgi:Domain of unknown function (DUF4397)
MNRLRIIAALFCVALLGCDKNAVQDLLTAPPAAAQIKFFNFGVGAPNVNFYAGDKKLTGISSTTGVESTLGTAYGAAAAGGFYVAVDPGQYDLNGRITAATDKDTMVSHVNTALVAGKRYSLYQSGFYNTTTKKVEAFLIEDDFTIPTSFATASVRFVNAISNANPMALYARATTADSTVFPIGAEVAYKSVAVWTSIPTGSYDLYTRYPGTTTNVILRTGVGFAGGHVYTVTARGDITSSATARVPTLDNTANY